MNNFPASRIILKEVVGFLDFFVEVTGLFQTDLFWGLKKSGPCVEVTCRSSPKISDRTIFNSIQPLLSQFLKFSFMQGHAMALVLCSTFSKKRESFGMKNVTTLKNIRVAPFYQVK